MLSYSKFLPLMVVAFMLYFTDNQKAEAQDQILFSACTSHSDCNGVEHARCQVLSPTCGQGTCICSPGFLEWNGTCLQGIGLNRKCSNSTFCYTPNAKCEKGVCACREGLQPGPGGIRMTCTGGVRYIGAQCSTDHPCYDHGNLQCSTDNICECQQGFVQYDSFRCRKKQFGDKCETDNDCLQLPNMKCSKDKKSCECLDGVLPVLAMIQYPEEILKPLIPNLRQGLLCLSSEEIAKEGESCYYEKLTVAIDRTKERPVLYLDSFYDPFLTEDPNLVPTEEPETTTESDKSEQQKYCSAPLQCAPCSLPSKRICVRPPHLMSRAAHPSQLQFSLVVILPFLWLAVAKG